MAIVLMGAVTAKSLSGMRAIHQEFDLTIQTYNEKLQLTTVLLEGYRESLLSIQSMLLIEDVSQIDELDRRYSVHSRTTNSAWENLHVLTRNSSELERLERIRISSQTSDSLYRQIKTLASAADFDTAKKVLAVELVPVQNQLQSELNDIADKYEELAKVANRAAYKKLSNIKQNLIILTALVSLLCLLVAYRIFLIVKRDEQQFITQQQNLEATVSSRTLELAGETLERKSAEQKVRRQQKRLATTLASIGDGVISTDIEGLVEYVNPAAELLLGKDLADLVGTPVAEVLILKDHSSSQNLILENLRERESTLSESLLVTNSATPVAVQLSITEIKDESSNEAGSVIVLRDVSETRALTRELEFEATHDSLTGLVNRREFEKRVRTALETAEDYPNVHTFCFIDLDRFKIINDTCGHAAGDRLLQELSSRISKSLRPEDTIARIGGDEFGILLDNTDVKAGVIKAEKIKAAVQEYRLSYEDKFFSVGASIGVVEINSSVPSVKELLKMADTACYMAKENGRNCVSLYQPGNTDLQQQRNEIDWANKIRVALQNHGFQLHCQPIQGVSTAHSESTHYEILIRMLDDNNELVYPGSFLPAAERHGLMAEIDRYVIQHAFHWLADNPVLSDTHRFSINLTGDSLSDPGFLAFVVETIDTTRVSLNSVIFEITESVAVNNLENAVEFMETLSELGCEFALDDFGKGFSSLTSLKNLPVDYLKIDGGFIKDMLESRTDEATVKAIIELARALDKQTVAEFVESQEISDKLAHLGVDYVQGFGIARPASISSVFGLDDNQTRIAA